ncbi:MAG: FtsX-like permease family protein [Gemmatimonadetes bacterium]|nr:FtsX-like permease family protein [Gemmatimonadota bacterium]
MLAELDDGYARRVEEMGGPAADRWYREEVMAFLVLLPGRGVESVEVNYGGWMMDGLRQVGMILRGFRRAPGFAVLAVLTLALGIGANALIFAIADRALFRPLPYPDADRIVSVLDGWGTSPGSLEILQREMGTVATIGGAIDASGMTLESADGGARRVSVARATPEYLEALGVEPTLGRRFLPEESQRGRGQVVLLSADFHASDFGGDPGAIGQDLVLDGDSYEIVGVLPQAFDFPSARNDLWIPALMDGSPENAGYHWGMGVMTLIARLDPASTPDLTRQELVRAQGDVRLANPLWTPPPNMWDDARVTPIQDARGQWARTPIFLLLGAVLVVLLVVCANVANLLLSRGLARQRDLAVRTALGAGRRRLAINEIMEVLVLGAMGCGLGLLLAGAGLDLLRPLLPPEVPGAEAVGLDARVILFTIGVTAVVALLAGLAPAFRVGRGTPGDFLRDAGRGRVGSRKRHRVTRVLVAAQMAAAVVLVTGAGLLGRSLEKMTRVDPGFAPEGRVTARFDLPPGLQHDLETHIRYVGEIHAALAADPMLDRVALASSLPFGSESEQMAVFIDGVTDDPNALPSVLRRRVTPNYFETMGVPVLDGRLFDETDGVGTPLVVMIDQTFADRFFPGEDPIGRIVRYPWRGAPPMEIVGLVGGTQDNDLATAMPATVYMPVAQLPGGQLGHAVVIATGRDPGSALGAIQNRARNFDGRMAVSEMAEYPELLVDSLAVPRLLTLLLVLFAGSTLVLGCIGVYGVAAFSARERIREIGVRMTLGAHPSEIRKRFFREGLILAIPGGVIGLVVAAAVGRSLSAFLYEVSPFDPVTFITVPLILVGAALLAVYGPARRATRVDPASVLREG